MPKEFAVRVMRSEDVNELPSFHTTTFDKNHFSVHLSHELLKDYFAELIKYNEFCYIVHEKDAENVITGYLIGGTGYDNAIKNFKSKNRFGIIKTLLKNPKHLAEKTFHLVRGFFIKPVIQNVVIVFLISVSKDYRKSGLGKLLLQRFESDLKENGINEYGLYVRRKNVAAINFYERLKFERKSEDLISAFYYKEI
jgi:ribosomal protein S18 acetylase RimI-like enzyme